MIVVDESRCVGCGRCTSFCTRHAIEAWGYAEIDAGKCSDCFGGVHFFGDNMPLADKELILDRARSKWDRLCIINCPVDALSIKEC